MHPKHLIVEAPERLQEVMAHSGYRVVLHVERTNGGELDGYNQSCIPAIVAGYQADEQRSAETAAEVDAMALLDELITQEQGADSDDPTPADPADPLSRAS